MGLSKKTRIQIFLVVDVVFFFLEIIVGFTVHSLALVADAFHMLNDIISLLIGLWAVNVATKRASSSTYTYGWARAELLGGLINGVFLVALCLSIFLQAIQRFFEPQEINNPMLILVVGGVGLGANILGLFLFHQHDHSHGDGEDHGEEEYGTRHDELGNAEQGRSDLPHSHKPSTDNAEHAHQSNLSWKVTPSSPTGHSPARHRHSVSSRRSRAHSRVDDIPVHPASLRNDILNHARMGGSDTEDYTSQSEDGSVIADDEGDPTEVSPLIKKDSKNKSSRHKSHRRSQHSKTKLAGVLVSHKDHKHSKPKASKTKGKGQGASEQDQNIRAQFLHVLGDALGSVGVIITALIIWLAKDWKDRFYADPAISIVITAIILKTAIPLVRDTSKPLLQAVPAHISVQDIRDDIEDLPGVRSCHHVHVWALTPSRLIATLDVELDFDFEGRNASRYMELAKEIKSCLSGHGIYNSTIQPEFCTNTQHAHAAPPPPLEADRQSSSSTVQTTIHDGRGPASGSEVGNEIGTTTTAPPANCGDRSCLLDRSNLDLTKQCCDHPSGSGNVTPKDDDAKGNRQERFRAWLGGAWARLWGWQRREKDVEALVDEKGIVVVREVELVDEKGDDKGGAKHSGTGEGGKVDMKEERGRTKARKGEDEESVVGAGVGAPFH